MINRHRLAKVIFLSNCVLLSASPLSARGEPASQELKLRDVRESQVIGGFEARNLFLDDSGAPIGVKLEHRSSGTPIYLLQMDSAPMAAIWVQAWPWSDAGHAHALEHLLAGKGTQGRLLSHLHQMRIAGHGAATWSNFVYYSFTSGTGMQGFRDLFKQTLVTLFAPDFTDDEARNELYHFSVDQDKVSKRLSLTEKGTVYAEISNDEGVNAPWYALMAKIYGKDHPFCLDSGGSPAALRTLTPAEVREFYEKHYALGPNLGMILLIPPQEKLEPFLGELEEFLRPYGNSNTKVGVETHVARPGTDKTIEFVSIPRESSSHPVDLTLGWPVIHDASLKNRVELTLLLSLLSDGSGSVLYKSMVDQKRREFDTGVTDVSMSLGNEYGTDSVRAYLMGIPGDRLTPELAEKLRKHVSGKIAQVARYEPGSPALRELNALALDRLTYLERSTRVWESNPPQFGNASTADWKRRLELVSASPGFKKYIGMHAERHSLQEHLKKAQETGRNLWKEVIHRNGLMEVPFAVAGKSDPALFKNIETQRKARIERKLSELKKAYAESDDQKALARFEKEQHAEKERMTASRSLAEKPQFVKSPPLTPYEGVRSRTHKWDGVPITDVVFSRSNELAWGMGMNLNGIPERLQIYVSVLPDFMTSVGLRERDQVTDYSEVERLITRDVLSFTAFNHYDTEGSDRYDLRLGAEATHIGEYEASLRLADRILRSSDFSVENLPRIREVMDQKILGAKGFLVHFPSSSLDMPNFDIRYQDRPMFLSLHSEFHRIHSYSRLRWRFRRAPTEVELTSAQQFVDSFIRGIQGLDRDAIKTRLNEANPEGLAGEVVQNWRNVLNDLPSHQLQSGLMRVWKEAKNEMSYGNSKAVSDLKELRDMLVNRSRMRLYRVGTPKSLKETQAVTRRFLEGLPEFRVEKSKPRRGRKLFFDNLKERGVETARQFPLALGFVDPEIVDGHLNLSAKIPRYQDAQGKRLFELLSSNLFGGGGAHTFYMKAWEAGISYGGGIRGNPETGWVSFNGRRSMAIPEILHLISATRDEMWKKPEAFSTSELWDYTLSQFFWTYEDEPLVTRAVALVNFLWSGKKLDQRRSFSKKILDLPRSQANRDSLVQNARSVLSKLKVPDVTDDELTIALRKEAQTIYLFVAPEEQLKPLDALFPANGLVRIYPSDFWEWGASP
jgi:hypothetical protein